MGIAAAPTPKWVGVSLIVSGLALNPWVLGYLLADDRRIGPPESFAFALLVDLVLVFTGLHLLVGWVDAVSWVRPVGRVRAAAFVGLVAAAVAGTYWRIASYQQGHSHTALVETGEHQATAAHHQWAESFYQRSLAAALKHGWFDIDNAFKGGFQADRINATHFPNLQYMFDDVILDPERPEWLVYDETPNGKVLMAMMFFTRRLEDVGPTPGGPIAQWHFHPYAEPRCAINGLWTVAKADNNGQCAEGVPVMRTPEMLHVWFIDHPLGRFTEMKVVPEYFQELAFDRRRLHPMAVHFAIGLFIVGVLIDAAARVTRKADLHRVAWINMVLAALATVTAVATGMTAEVLLTPTHEAHATLDQHRLLGFVTLGIILVMVGWRYMLRGRVPSGAAALLYLALAATGVGAVGATGYYGGEMVYTHGAAVRAIDRFARERYWKQVREVYRHEAPDAPHESAHH